MCASDLEGSGKLRTLDLLIPRLRVERRAALVVSSSPEALDAVATLLTQRRITHFRLDGPDVALGTRLHAAARFPWSFKAGGGVRVLLCAVAAAPDLTKEVVGKVDSLIALDVADEGWDRAMRAQAHGRGCDAVRTAPTDRPWPSWPS